MGAFYSFTDYRGYGSWNFVGVDNYVRLFQDPLVRHSYIFTIGFALLTAILTNVISVLLAVMMTQNIRFRSFITGGHLCRQRHWQQLPVEEPSRQREMGMGGNRHCGGMAGVRSHHGHLHDWNPIHIHRYL